MSYIKREDALDAVLFALVGTGYQSNAIYAIRDVPTADVVEVVRCKDCKHLEIINDGKVYAKCTMTDFEFLPFGTDTREHYCGYGERSENGT